jgi:hypothetical protein
MILSAMASSLAKVSTAWIFPLYFQLPYLPEETCARKKRSKRDLVRWKVPARLNWDSILPCSQLHFAKVQ